jgi:methionine synthase / methylenetetrahydrofolate reductase(NADPH)
VGGQPIGAPTAFHVGVIANPGAPGLDEEVRRFEYKAEAGAEFAVTPPVYDLEAFDQFRRRTAHVPVPIIAAVRPFDSLLHAEYLANEVPNIRVPEALLARMRQAEGADAAVEEGIAIARELARQLRARAQGLQIGGPMTSVLAVLDGL